MSDQLVAETPTWQHTQHSQQTNIHAPVGFEPTISAGERSQTYALDRAATGTGLNPPRGLEISSKINPEI